MRCNNFFLLWFILRQTQVSLAAASSQNCNQKASEEEFCKLDAKYELPSTIFASHDSRGFEDDMCSNGIPLLYGKCLCHFGFTGASCETLIDQKEAPLSGKENTALGTADVCYGDDCTEYVPVSYYEEDSNVDPRGLQWEIVPRWKHCKPLKVLVGKGDILDGTFVVISTGLGNSKSELHVAHGTKSPATGKIYRFFFVPKSAGKKSRLELSTCFTTINDVTASYSTATEEIEHQLKTSCPVSNIPVNRIHNYSFEIYLPKLDCDVTGQYIITQWHGTPEPTILLDQFGCVAQISIEDFHRICTFGKCKEGKVLDNGGRFTGIRYNQGGYPPLTMMLKDGHFLITARSDERVFIPKKGCSLLGLESVKCEAHPRQQLHVIWKMPAENFPFNTWVKFHWRIRWSEYGSASRSNNSNYGIHLSDAQIEVWMNGGKIVNWVGPCGRNDNGRTPYFKAGIYNPSGSDAQFMLFFRRFLHEHESQTEANDEELRKNTKMHNLNADEINQNELKNLKPLEFSKASLQNGAKCILSPAVKNSNKNG